MERNADKKVRARLEGIREKMLVRFGEKGTKIIFISSLVALSLVILLIIGFFLIRINEFEIKGDVTAFNESEIVEAADVDIGDGLFWKSSFRIKKNLEKNLPVAFDVTVFKTPFGKVIIDFKLKEVDYYTRVGEKYYAFNSDLKILDSAKSRSKYTALGAVYVELPKTRDLKVGERVIFYDTVEETDTEGELLYEVRDESAYSYVGECLKSLKKNQFHSGADAILLDEKFEIALIYAEQFRINLGTTDSLDVKFSILNEMLLKIEEDKKNEGKVLGKARIDLSDTTQPSLREDYTLDFSEYVD